MFTSGHTVDEIGEQMSKHLTIRDATLDSDIQDAALDSDIPDAVA